MCTWLCLECDLRPTNHEPAFGIRHIGDRIIRECASAVLRVCNMIELVHAKLTHTYATTRRLSGMPVGRATVVLSVFQPPEEGRDYWISPKTSNSGRLHNHIITPALESRLALHVWPTSRSPSTASSTSCTCTRPLRLAAPSWASSVISMPLYLRTLMLWLG